MAEILKLSFGRDGFATIQMVNGENRFTTPVVAIWNTTLDKVLDNPDVKGLIITGTGKFFSNGIDLTWLAENDSVIFMRALVAFITRVMVLPIPTVALINGHAFGGGAFLALACDFRVMQPERGWLCWPETAIGMRFGTPLLNIARCKIPPGVVQRDALIYSKRLTAQEALDFQLVDVVTKATEMEAVGKQLVFKALGPRGLDRFIVGEMKKDIYGEYVNLSKL